MKMRTREFSFVLVVCVWLCGQAMAGLAGRIGKAVGKAKQSEYAVRIVEPESGTVVYTHNATKAMTPASNMKLITTAAALKYLGPLFQYRTRVGLCGNTLVVIGSGDPLLGDPVTDERYGREEGWVFDEAIQSLQELGVEDVTDIIVDTTVFDDERVHPNWLDSDLNRWYACEVCGLNYRANCIDVTTANQGGRVAIQIEPATSFIEIINEIKPVSSGDSAVGAYRTPHPNRIALKGKCKDREGPFDVAIEQPGAFFGFLLAEHLVRAGIPVSGRLVEKAFDTDCELTPVAEYTTPLIDCLHRANKDSLGLAAEALLKTIAAHESPDNRNGSWEKGRELIGKYLTGLGIPRDEFHIDDGSGLSRDNLLSARDRHRAARRLQQRELGTLPDISRRRRRGWHHRTVLQGIGVPRRHPGQDRLHQWGAVLFGHLPDGFRPVSLLDHLESFKPQPRHDQRDRRSDHGRIPR